MEAKDSEVYAEHLGVAYHFCSQQCRENFIARPSLYIGKQAGQRQPIIKHRHFLLDCTIDATREACLEGAIEQLLGVQHVHIQKRRVSIDYNLLEVRAEQIENVLSGLGLKLADSWLERLKRNWLHYTENNELDHLASSGTPCCNRPPGHGSS